MPYDTPGGIDEERDLEDDMSARFRFYEAACAGPRPHPFCKILPWGALGVSLIVQALLFRSRIRPAWRLELAGWLDCIGECLWYYNSRMMRGSPNRYHALAEEFCDPTGPITPGVRWRNPPPGRGAITPTRPVDPAPVPDEEDPNRPGNPAPPPGGGGWLWYQPPPPMNLFPVRGKWAEFNFPGYEPPAKEPSLAPGEGTPLGASIMLAQAVALATASGAAGASGEELCCKMMAWAEQMTVEACARDRCGEPPEVPDNWDRSVRASFQLSALVNIALQQVGQTTAQRIQRREITQEFLSSSSNLTSFAGRVALAMGGCET